MTEDPKPDQSAPTPRLEYFAATQPAPRTWRFGWIYDAFAFPATPELRKWWARRQGYRVMLLAVFVMIAWYVGPNEINFRKPTPLNAADFVPVVESQCVPVVRAMKQYQRDHGKLPGDTDDLVPKYLSAAEEKQFRGEVENGRFVYFGQWNHLIEYSFAPGNEHWSVHGPVVNGVIPTPPVTLMAPGSAASRLSK